jgi:alkylhydroperoxidase family enzyme
MEPGEWGEEVDRWLGGSLGSVAELEGKETAAPARPLNILRTIAHQPRLLGPFLGFAAALATQGELTRRDSELLALRAAWNCQSAFEWGHHVLYARAAGLSDAQIAAIAIGPSAPSWVRRDGLLLRAADELHGVQQLTEPTWDELREEFNDAQLVEIPFVVGQYTMLSMVTNATGVPVEDGLPELPERGPR